MSVPRALAALPALAAAAALVAGCGSAGLGPEARQQVTPAAERPAAKAFTLPALSGGAPVTLAAHRGKPVVLNFWASWCGPCRTEMPELAAFARAHPEVAMVGVDVNDVPADARAFARKKGARYPHGIDRAGRVSERYEVQGLPTTVVIDPEGRVATTWPGPITQEDLERLTSQAGASPG